MLLPRSELNVNDKSRERLFPWWSMLLFGATVAAMLLLFFPQRWLLSQVGQTRPGDRVSEQYLATLLASQPDNAELRLALVRQYLAGNGWPQARKALAPLLHSADPQQRATAQLLQFDSIAGQMAAEVEDSPARAQLLQQLWQFTASSTQTSARLTLLANEAERQNRYDIASRVYQQLIEANPDDAPRWLEQAAQSALARGQYQDAAARYFQAQQLAHTLPLRRRYLLAGLRTLQSGNLLPQAVAAAREHAGTLADDRETQLFLVKLCRAAGDLNEAERYARKLLQMSLLFELQQMQARSGWQLRHVSDATCTGRKVFGGATSDHLRAADAAELRAATPAQDPSAKSAKPSKKKTSTKQRAEDSTRDDLMQGKPTDLDVEVPKALRKAAAKRAKAEGLDLQTVVIDALHAYVTAPPR